MNLKTSYLLALALGTVVVPEAWSRSLIGTAEDGNLAAFIPAPGVGLPNPSFSSVPGLPAGSRPHGTAIVDINRGLVADFANSRFFVISLEPTGLVATIPTPAISGVPAYNGSGTIAVSPDRSVALASGRDFGDLTPHVRVIRAPFSAQSPQSAIVLPAAVPVFATQNIAFDGNGRAYISHIDGISVIDPPYDAIAFTVPVSGLTPGGIAVSPGNDRLLATYVDFPETNIEFVQAIRGSSAASLADAVDEGVIEGKVPFLVSGVDAFSLPLSPDSSSTRTELLSCDGCFLPGIAITPDGDRAVLATGGVTLLPAGTPVIFSLPAPFTNAGAAESFTLPAGFPLAAGFEDISISLDGSEALVTGNSSTQFGPVGGLPVLHVRGPFVAGQAVLSALNIPGGRGVGSVRFAPAGTIPPTEPPRPAVPVPSLSVMGLVALIGFLLLTAAWQFRRRAS